MKIVLGADHGGFELKEAVKQILGARGVEVEDVGCHSLDSTDYPDYAADVCVRVSEGRADQGVLVCTTGLGMSIASNKFPRVRAALCLNPVMARMAREHNDANVLVLGGKLLSGAELEAVVEMWLSSRYSSAERHVRRLGKVVSYQQPSITMPPWYVCPEASQPSIMWSAVSAVETIHQTEALSLPAASSAVRPKVLSTEMTVSDGM